MNTLEQAWYNFFSGKKPLETSEEREVLMEAIRTLSDRVKNNIVGLIHHELIEKAKR